MKKNPYRLLTGAETEKFLESYAEIECALLGLLDETWPIDFTSNEDAASHELEMAQIRLNEAGMWVERHVLKYSIGPLPRVTTQAATREMIKQRADAFLRRRNGNKGEST